MARAAREKSRSGIYHIMLRGINRQIIFEDDEDKDMFLTTLESFKGNNNYNLYGYCLMTNHIHILMKELDDEISTAIKRICASYVFWYNRKYERCGHLFQERFKSEVVETDEYFLTVLRYIHQNPIKARMIKNIDAYKWTSYSEYINTNKSTMVDIDFGLDLFSPKRKKAIDLFIKYHKEDNNDKCLDYEDFIRLTDKEAREEIANLGIKNISVLQNLDKDDRDNILRRLKGIPGASIRQLARITGISKSVIDRA